jgi:hypothetical protein
MPSMKSMKQPIEFSVLNAVGGRQALWGHDLGRQVREKLAVVLEQTVEGTSVIIALQGVEVMDYSFASEVFGKIIGGMSSLYPRRAVVLSEASGYVGENLAICLQSLGLMALAVEDSGVWELIGKVAETDRDTAKAIAQRKRASAAAIAKDLDIQVTTCNQRLRKLSESGIITRQRIGADGGGEQFEYLWPL